MNEKNRMVVVVNNINNDIVTEIDYYLKKLAKSIGMKESAGAIDDSNIVYREYKVEK